MGRSVSLAMIVKDESENLAECLSSVKAIADEICIVDTGSCDDTIEIARRFGAKVHVYLWCDDFAAPRNESLRMCTRDWVFVMDADERLAPEDLPRICALADGPTDCCYRFVSRNYTNTLSVSEFHSCSQDDPYARGFAGWYPSVKVRFFPNHRGAHFEGKVHEVVHASLERQGIRVLDSPVPIHHYPFLRAEGRLREKQELYVRLGHLKVAERPEDPKGFVELGNQYAELHDALNAAAAYRQALKLDPSNPVVLKDLGGVLHMLKRNEEAKHALHLSLELDPGLADAWRNLGVIFVDEKQWDAAVECFEQAVKLNPAWTDGPRYLSVALEGTGRLPEAAQASRQALEANPDSNECLKLYIHQMLRLERRADARRLLAHLTEMRPDNADLYNALGELCFYDNLFEDSMAYFNKAAEKGLSAAHNNLGVVLFRLKRFSEAREAFEKCLAADPGHPGALRNLHRVVKQLGEVAD